MSIGTGDIAIASDPEPDPPYDAPGVSLSEWPDGVKKAWHAFHNAEEGDLVRWGDRVKPLEVVNVETTDDGFHDLHVEGPLGGTYTVRERYDEGGYPRFYADDSSALDLELVDAPEPNDRPFTADMFDRLTHNILRASVSAWENQDYDEYRGALQNVVKQWADDVSYMRWHAWPYDWEDDTPEYIFGQVVAHADTDTDDDKPLKKRAQEALITEVAAEGKQQAHARMIDDVNDYAAIAAELASNAVDRDKRKANLDAREAARSVVDEFIDAHTEPVYRAILNVGWSDPYEYELYEDLPPDEMAQEMARDVLDQDVWEKAREEHQDQGTHDPTVRGLRFDEYDQLVEVLTDEALREHNANENKLLFTTVREVVQDFADQTDAHEWPYDFGGVAEQNWGEGDTEDIFTSIAMHAETDPDLFNPFARDKERKIAVQVLSEAVHSRASNAIDRGEIRATKPVPADEYLEKNFGGEMTFNDIRDDAGLTAEDFIRLALESVDNWDDLAGWTFVDELVEEGDASVPFVSGPWVLADYGLVKKDDRQRRLAWFNRDNGSVLALQGMTTNPPTEGGYGFEDFHLLLITWENTGDNAPEALLSDVPLETAFTWAKDFMDSESADINVIETKEGEYYLQEAINEDDFNTRTLASGIAPSFSLPGPDFTVPDAFTYGTETFKKFGAWLRDNSRIVNAMSTTATALFLGEVSYIMMRVSDATGLSVQPTFRKDRGVGIRGTAHIGQSKRQLEEYNPDDPDQVPYTGDVEANIYITPGAFRFIGSEVTPDWLYRAGPNASVIGALGKKVAEPLRTSTGDYFRTPRVTFLGAHLPAEAEGRPDGVDEYETPRIYNIAGAESTNYYDLDVGDTLEEDTLRLYLRKAAVHGYMVPTGSGYYSGGNEADQRIYDERPQKSSAISHSQVQEIGWSLNRDHLLGPVKERLVGTPDEVEEYADSSEGPVITNEAFLDLWTEFQNTPNTTMLDQAWKFYRERAEESDEFTLVDAYDRFRMGLVYDTTANRNRAVLANYIRSEAKSGTLEGKFTRTSDRDYVWSVDDNLLAADNVFDDPDIDSIGDWLYFPQEPRKRPPNDVSHYYIDSDAQEVVHHVYRGGTSHSETVGHWNDELDTPGMVRTETGENYRWYKLSTWNDLNNALTPSVQNTIFEMVNDNEDILIAPEEYDPENPVREEERKWIQADAADRMKKLGKGSVSWDELSGTDLSVFGLFLRGVDMDAALKAADHWNLEDRFQTRATSVLPANFTPSRPDLPDFEDWLDRRRGKGAVGNAVEKSKAKATYLREMSQELAGLDVESGLGIDPDLRNDIETQREIQEHYEEADPYNLDAFYGDEFGNAFDDVAEKFNEQRQYEEGEFDRPDTVE